MKSGAACAVMSSGKVLTNIRINASPNDSVSHIEQLVSYYYT